MRKIINQNRNWLRIETDLPVREIMRAKGTPTDMPFTWNAFDGQDGGNDYKRCAYWFVKRFSAPELAVNEQLYVEFKGVNSSAEVWINGCKVTSHDGGYSTFRANLTPFLNAENILCVRVDNAKTERVYPQTADFTFYGGIYRDVNFIIVNENHFDLDFYGASGVRIDPTVEGNDGIVNVTTFVTGSGDVSVEIYDGNGNLVMKGTNAAPLRIQNARLWNGIHDPYLYTAKAILFKNGAPVDSVSMQFGFRTFFVDPKKGFFLNGKPYPLRGVSRHQDRKQIGNVLTRFNHEEDAALIREIGTNTVRLAHYQHDDYFYDLCDRYGFIVWAEIPYISRHMPDADENAVNQMKELIYQQYHHASICFWGISNEITMFRKHKKEKLALHQKLNDLCHALDAHRLTTLACFATCSPFNKIAHITDLVSWNLYLGWYVPGKFLNGVWFKIFRLFFPNRAVGLSEYGAEGMPNLHSKRPKRGDNSEEHQLNYHLYMLRFFARSPYLWVTYVWNMFDFASDARNQGGEAGMNHKGLVTFDRQTKKDAFYAYKAYWSTEPFVYICGKRFVNRTGRIARITVLSNAGEVTLSCNGKLLSGTRIDEHTYLFKVPLSENTLLRAEFGKYSDECILRKVSKPDGTYRLHGKSNTHSWQK